MRAYGPGLEGGKVGKSADFVVETTGNDVGQLGEWIGHFRFETYEETGLRLPPS